MKVLNIVLIVLLVAFLVPVLWEYTSLRFGIITGFKSYGGVIVELVRKIFRMVGVSFARLVTILEWIGFRHVLSAIDTTIDFYVQLGTSWWWAFVGFFTYIRQFDAARVYLNIGNIAAQVVFWTLFIKLWNRRREGSLTFRKSEWSFVAFMLWAFSVLFVNVLYEMYVNGSLSNAWINVTSWYE